MIERVCLTPDNLTFTQGLEEIVSTLEFRHFYVGVTYFMKGMGVTAGALDEAVFLSKSLDLSGIMSKWVP